MTDAGAVDAPRREDEHRLEPKVSWGDGPVPVVGIEARTDQPAERTASEQAYDGPGLSAAIDLRKLLSPFALAGKRNSFVGSAAGGIAEARELLSLCAKEKIVPEIGLVGMSGIDDAWTKVVAKEARYRFVVDTAKTWRDGGVP